MVLYIVYYFFRNMIIKRKVHHNISMDNKLIRKRTFTHWHWCIDTENYIWCFLLVENINGVPSASYVVPITEPYLKCHIYPFIRN